MKRYLLLFLIAIYSCSGIEKGTNSLSPISQKEFLDKPFVTHESIDGFSSLTKPDYKLQKLLGKNKHYKEKTDTIYRFYYKKSEIFFYKTSFGQEFLLAGKILNKQIKLNQGIHVGMSKDEFSNRFKDTPVFSSDSIEMKGQGSKYTFIFKNNKLSRINIDNYFD